MDTQTHTHTTGSNSMTSTADSGGYDSMVVVKDYINVGNLLPILNLCLSSKKVSGSMRKDATSTAPPGHT